MGVPDDQAHQEARAAHPKLSNRIPERAMKTLRVSILLVATLGASSAFAETCARSGTLPWKNGLSVCDIYPEQCLSNPPPLSPGQERYWISQTISWLGGLGTGSPGAQEACEKYIKRTRYKGTTPKLYFPGRSQDYAICYIDLDNNNTYSGGAEAVGGSVSIQTFERETMCERTPKGPYKDVMPAVLGVDGASFSDAQRAAFRTENNQTLCGSVPNMIRSDAGPARPPQLVPYELDYLTWGNIYLWSWTEETFIPLIGNAWSAPNVDHIIPRRDKFGCDCGPDSNANALIVSWELNVGMSNFSQDARRLAILERYSDP
jgi:hypothetical protein